MPMFDAEFSDSVGTFDFSKYASRRAVLAAKKWPLALVPLDTIADAFDQEDAMATGFRPGEAELRTAPTLYNWQIIDHTGRGQGLRLIGLCWEHPVLRGARLITTSHLVAMDMGHFKWARTLSRY